MLHFKFSDKDQRYLFIKCDNATDVKCMRATQKWINLVDPICYLPTWSGPPITQDFLWDYIKPNGEIIFYASIGLWQSIYNYFKQMGWEFDGLDKQYFKRTLPHTYEEFCDVVHSWHLKLTPRPYQLEACYKILQWKRSISELATRFGKTLSAYIIFRYAIEYLGAHKILMIVPSVTLVKQAADDFAEYENPNGTEAFFNTEQIYSGGKLREGSNFTVGTYQSLIKFIDRKDKKYNPSFFDDYDVVFVDETHKAKANQIKTLISQPFMNKVILAFGLSGTIPYDHTIDRYAIHSLLGALIQQIKSSELIDEGYLSHVYIYQHKLHYKDINKQRKTWIDCAEYCLGDDVEYKEVIDPVMPPKPKELKKPKEPVIKKKKTETDDQYNNRCNIAQKEYDQKLNEWAKKNNDRITAWEKECKRRQEKGSTVVKRKYIRDDAKFLMQNVKKLPEGVLYAKNIAIQNNTQEAKNIYKKTLEKLITGDTGANMYHTEVMMAHFFDERIDHLIDVLKQCPYNTLVLAQHREYIKYVWEKVKAAFPDRPVIYVIGGSKDQKTFKETLKNCDNAILIAGFSIMSTGVTLSNLAYEVLFESIYMSRTVTLQSLGRTLALAKPPGVNHATIFDFVDCFDKKASSNRLEKMGRERRKLYAEANFPYEETDYWL